MILVGYIVVAAFTEPWRHDNCYGIDEGSPLLSNMSFRAENSKDLPSPVSPRIPMLDGPKDFQLFSRGLTKG